MQTVEVVSSDVFANNFVMNFNGFRKADGASSQSFEMGTKIEMLPFNRLSIPFRDKIPLSQSVMLISPPIISAVQPKRETLWSSLSIRLAHTPALNPPAGTTFLGEKDSLD